MGRQDSRVRSSSQHRNSSQTKWLAAAVTAVGFQLVPLPGGPQAARADLLLWTNGGATGVWDSAAADTNWNDVTTSASGVTYADTTGGNPTAVQFSGSTSPAGTVTVGNVTGSTPNGVSPASVEFTSGSNSFTLAAASGNTLGIQGSATVTLDSGYTGTAFLNLTDTYTVATSINGGTLEINASDASPYGVGTGSIVLGGGTFEIHQSPTIANNFTADFNTSSTLLAGSTGYNGTYTGNFSTTAVANATNTTLNITGGDTETIAPATTASTMSGFSGLISIATGTTFRLNGDGAGSLGGSSTAVINLGSGTSTGALSQGSTNGTELVGGLAGGASTTLKSGSSATPPAGTANNFNSQSEFVIGGAGQPTVFSGVISNPSNRLNIEVTGNGSLTLTNANTYTSKSDTAIEYEGAGTIVLGNGQQPLAGTANTFTGMPASNGGGALYVSNTTGSATGVSPVYVQGASSTTGSLPSGATTWGGLFGGDGIISSDVTTVVNSEISDKGYVNSAAVLASFLAGPHIAPGAAGANTSKILTLNGGLQLGDYTNLDFSLDTLPATAADAEIAVSNTAVPTLTNPLTLPDDSNINVNLSFPNGNPALGVPYTLISYTGADSYGGGTSALLAGWSDPGVPAGDTATFSDTGSAIDVTFAAVPEPASLGILGLGALGLLRRRRDVIK